MARPLLLHSTGKQARRTLVLITIGYLAIYLAWLLWGRDDAWERYLVGNLAMVFTATLAALSALRVRNSALASRSVTGARLPVGAAQSDLSRAWALMAAGLGLWALGDLARLFYGWSAPAPVRTFTPVDWIHLAGCVPFAAGMVLHPRRTRQSFSLLGMLVDVTLVTTAAVMLIWLVAAEPLFKVLPVSPVHRLALLYPFGDLFLLVVLLNLYVVSDAGYTPVAYGWITLALLSYTFADVTYAVSLQSNGYFAGGPVDFSWAFGDLMLALAGVAQLERIEQVGQTQPLRLPLRVLGRFQALLPLVLAIVQGWFVVLRWQLDGQVDTAVLWVTAVVAMGLIARQGMLAGELEMEKYASLVSSVAEPAFVCDRRGRLRMVNPALLAATGYAADRDLLRNPLQLLLDPAEGVGALISQGLQRGWSGELFLRRKDGRLVPISLALRPLLGNTDQRLALAGTAHDLSEQKRQQADLLAAYEQIAHDRAELEQLNLGLESKVAEKTADLTRAMGQLAQQNQALQQLDELKSEFVALVSHELRAPLTNINSGIELVLMGPHSVTPRAAENLELVQGEIRRLTRFVETILDLSALDAGKLPLYPGPVLLQAVSESLKQQLSHNPEGARMDWQVPAGLPPLLADEQALMSIFFHLLDNAFKYAPEGRILFSAGQAGEEIWISVEDEGPGIPTDQLPLLFERFFRANAADAQTVYGHGLGLYIVRRLVEAMGGSVSAENCTDGARGEPHGVGTRFTVRLPLLPHSSDFERGATDAR
jgi:PAS domain S-box-containing protein